MNSANSESTNSTRKTQNDQKPRRLALKFSQRRQLIGESVKPRRLRGSSASISGGGAGSWILTLVRSSTSHLPRLEIDARIDPRVGEIGDQRHQQTDQRKDVKRREHHRIIAVEHTLEPEQAQAGRPNASLAQPRAGKDGGPKPTGQDGQHR